MSARRFLLDAWGRAGGYFGGNGSTIAAAAAAAGAATTTLGLGIMLDPEGTTHRQRHFYPTTTTTTTTSCEAKKIPQANLTKRVSLVTLDVVCG